MMANATPVCGRHKPYVILTTFSWLSLILQWKTFLLFWYFNLTLVLIRGIMVLNIV